MNEQRNIGRYVILEELGHGAMGTVYRAKDPAMDRIVAIKTIISLALASQQGSEFRERFYREARAAGALAHPGIVPVFDVGEHDGLPFLVMEFINGRTLEDAMKKGERMTLERVCEIGQQIAEALAHAHKNGVVHRDIKPANILLTSAEVYGIERPKITDFGVAKLAAGQITLSGQMLGTPAFMPPEQFTGAAIDGRADLFSLGVILYWMATGEQPFPGGTMTSVSYKVVNTDPAPPRKLNPAISADLERVIMKCLMKNPAERYQTGEELARDLGAVRSGAKMATTLQTAAPQLQTTDSSLDATLDSHPSMAAPAAAVTAAVPAAVSAPATTKAADGKGTNKTMLAAIGAIAALIILFGWLAMRRGTTTPASPAETVPAEAAAVPATPLVSEPSPAPAAPVSVNAAPVASAAAKAASKSTVASHPISAAAPTAASPSPVLAPAKPAAAAASVDFDPHTLDAKENARLRIDAEGMPVGLNYTVQMNGKVYLQATALGAKTQDDNLFVPEGVHEFKVIARSDAVEKESNIVSTEFKAKKRKTLKIELRLQGKGPEAGTPQGLYPTSQLVVSLK